MARRAMLWPALAALAFCQSCVGDVELPEETADWTLLQTPAAVWSLDGLALASDGEGRLFMGTDGDEALWRSMDGGRTWAEKTSGLKPRCSVSDLLVTEGGTVFAALSGGGVFVSRNHGESWMQVNNHLTDLFVQSLAADDDGILIAGTSQGRIFRSGDDGNLWMEVEGDPIERAVIVLIADSAGAVYAGSLGQGVFFTTDGGLTWTPSSDGLQNLYVRCMAIDNGGAILAGTNAGIFRLEGAGGQWVQIGGDVIAGSIYAIAVDRSGCIFAGKTGGAVARSRDGGASWESADTGVQDLTARSLLCTADVMLAGTYGNGAFRSTDGGESWIAPFGYYPVNPAPEHYSPAFKSLAVDSRGAHYLLSNTCIYRSQDGCATWMRACGGLERWLYCLAIHPSSSIFAGTAAGIYISNDSGDSWSRADTFLSAPARVFALDVAENGAMFGLTSSGVISSADGGLSWEYVLAYATASSLGTGADGRIYLGTLDEGVLGSEDGGGTWRRMTDSLNVYAVDADRVGNVLAACENGILASRDGGESWSEVPLGGYGFYWYTLCMAPGGEIETIYDNKGTLYTSEDCFSSWKTTPVPFLESMTYLGPTGHLFFIDRSISSLYRSRNPLY